MEIDFDDIIRMDAPKELSGKDQLKKDAEYQKNATDKYGDYIEKTASSKMSDSAKKRLARDLMNKDFEIPESVKSTVKEVKSWMRTLKENRYKRTYNSDCRRVSWLVNNNLAEDYEGMPKSIRKIVKSIITEGGNGILEPIQKAKSQRDAINYVKKFLKDEKSYGGDFGNIKNIKFVGNVSSEDKLDKMGMRYQDRSAVVGVVDGEYWWSIWRRS